MLVPDVLRIPEAIVKYRPNLDRDKRLKARQMIDNFTTKYSRMQVCLNIRNAIEDES
jgi:hypothetical protein